jgi:hypothetical protein
MESSSQTFIVAAAVFLALWFVVHKGAQREQRNEQYLGKYNLYVNTGSPVKMLTSQQPQTDIANTGLSDITLLYPNNTFQGSPVELAPGKEIEFMRQVPGVRGETQTTRVWKYKSLKKNPYKMLKFTAHIANKKKQNLVIYATPRFSSIEDLDAYLQEDPNLKSVLAYDPEYPAPIIFTVALA